MDARAAERLAGEQAEYQAKLAAREDNTRRTGKKPGGKPPRPPQGGVKASDQVHLADADSRIMPVSGGGFEQSYNAQAANGTSAEWRCCGLERPSLALHRSMRRRPRSATGTLTNVMGPTSVPIPALG